MAFFKDGSGYFGTTLDTKCETCDLEVPAHAEIIIEGEVLCTSAWGGRTIYGVKCITYRKTRLPLFPTRAYPLVKVNC